MLSFQLPAQLQAVQETKKIFLRYVQFKFHKWHWYSVKSGIINDLSDLISYTNCFLDDILVLCTWKLTQVYHLLYALKLSYKSFQWYHVPAVIYQQLIIQKLKFPLFNLLHARRTLMPYDCHRVSALLPPNRQQSIKCTKWTIYNQNKHERTTLKGSVSLSPSISFTKLNGSSLLWVGKLERLMANYYLQLEKNVYWWCYM